MVSKRRKIALKRAIFGKGDPMPYIAVKGFPKDDETKKKVVEEINEVFLKYWGCPQKAINISMEAIDPADWDEKITNGEIPQNKEYMMILDGEKQYQE